MQNPNDRTVTTLPPTAFHLSLVVAKEPYLADHVVVWAPVTHYRDA